MLDATPPDVLTRRDVYEPAEDSLLLLEALARDAGDLVPGARALDCGTGTGIVALWLAREGAASVLAIDANPAAARLARENAARLGLAGRVQVARGDLLAAVSPSARFDLVAFNAPYLPSGPDERLPGEIDRAFHGGEGGVEVAARFLGQVVHHLAPDGRAYVVVSDRGDLPALGQAARAAGLSASEVARASFFFERVLVWRLAPLRV